MKKGFTLIELLAVIVILAIIALIAVPIVLNIIEESKNNTTLRSAEMYLDAVEMSIATSTINNKKIKDGTYDILENSNICLEYTDNKCTNELKVEADGSIPSIGSTITISSGQITNTSLLLNNKIVVKNEKGQLTYLNLKYKIGHEVTFDPGDQDRTWNVIGEDETTVTLMLTENYGRGAWDVGDNSYGPQTALEILNSVTTSWDNVDPISNYTYINNLNGTAKPYGYQKIEIKDGVTKLTHKDGEIITEVSGETRARILSLEELLEIAQKTNPNLKEENLREYIERNLQAINAALGTNETTVDGIISELSTIDGFPQESKYIQTYLIVAAMIYDNNINPTYDILLPDYLYQNLYSDQAPYGYWILSSNAGSSDSAWYVDCFGTFSGDKVNYEYYNYHGVRPIITIPKTKLQ